MVAYSFQPRFEAPILTRRKVGTIRAVGKRRHARPGDALQLYTGMRTRSCRLLARAECASVDAIHLYFGERRVWLGHLVHGAPILDLDAFAQTDGFAEWDDMAAFWREVNPPKRLGPWTGLWIRWTPESVVTP